MKKGSLIFLTLLVTLLFCATPVFSNVWIDENFDGTGPTSPPIWVQGDGGGATVSPSDATLDIYSNGGLGGVTITGSPLYLFGGTKTSSRSFDGTYCYELINGGTITVGPNICNPANGAFVILQFGVSFESIPTSGLSPALFQYLWDTDTGVSPDNEYRFYVRFASDGSKIDILAGEDYKNSPPSEATIGSISSANEWKFITMVMQNNAGSATYNNASLPGGTITQNEGVAFYCSSTTQGHFIPMTGNDTSKTYRGWKFDVDSASGVKGYIDALYWEGGMDFGFDPSQNIRPFDYAGSPSSVNDWTIY